MKSYSLDRPGEPRLVTTVEELYGINPNIVKVHIPKDEYAFAFSMRPMAFHTPTRNDYGFAFRAGNGFTDSLRKWRFTHTENSYWHIWFPPTNTSDEVFILGLADMIAQRYPEARSRALKAARLVLAGNVAPRPEPDFPHEYIVESLDTKGRRYQVYIDPDNRKNWHCMIIRDKNRDKEHTACPDRNFAPMMKHGRRCKHILAAWMFTRLQKKEASVKPPAAPTAKVEASSSQPDIYSTPEQDEQQLKREVKLRAEAWQTHPESSDLFQQFDLSQPDPDLDKRR
jgi:hypothetical protein